MTDYDKLAQDYAEHRRPHPEVLKFILNDVFPVSIVLEVGCGTGNYISAIQSARGSVCFGVDPSEGMLSRARKHSDNVTWLTGRAESLPVGDSSVDCVFSVDVIHHVSDRRRYFEEAFRALQAGGIICTATDSERILRNRPLAQYFPETVAVELKRYPAIDELRVLMQNAGFTEVSDCVVEQESLLTDFEAYRHKAFSSLHLISDAAFARGIAKMEQDLHAGPIRVVSRYLLLCGRKPQLPAEQVHTTTIHEPAEKSKACRS
jgi:ubiquinone/menaquinone biosynthesis C-methylase UbiE